jgi:hypothetical protein
VSSARRAAAVALLLALACSPAVAVRPGADGLTVFRFEGRAEEVILSGTMTDWRPRPLSQRGDAFELRLALPPGRYEYRLEVHDNTGVHSALPEGAERTEDGYGGENGVLRVP